MLIEPKVVRVQKNFRIAPEAADMIAKLTKAYDTTEGRIVEAIMNTYGPVLLRDAKKGAKK